jgi:hypothetical protein
MISNIEFFIQTDKQIAIFFGLYFGTKVDENVVIVIDAHIGDILASLDIYQADAHRIYRAVAIQFGNGMIAEGVGFPKSYK